MEDVQFIRGLVWRAEQEAVSRKALAAEWGVSVQYIADVLNGRRDPGKSILKALGYERVVLYRKIGTNRNRACPVCHGSGEYEDAECRVCSGSGMIN